MIAKKKNEPLSVRSKFTTHRAPHMEKYVDIVKAGRRYIVRLHVHNQIFSLGSGVADLSRTEAEWFRDMICIALDNVVKDAAP